MLFYEYFTRTLIPAIMKQRFVTKLQESIMQVEPPPLVHVVGGHVLVETGPIVGTVVWRAREAEARRVQERRRVMLQDIKEFTTAE